MQFSEKVIDFLYRKKSKKGRLRGRLLKRKQQSGSKK
jgi:hypothetical protein